MFACALVARVLETCRNCVSASDAVPRAGPEGPSLSERSRSVRLAVAHAAAGQGWVGRADARTCAAARGHPRGRKTRPFTLRGRSATGPPVPGAPERLGGREGRSARRGSLGRAGRSGICRQRLRPACSPSAHEAAVTSVARAANPTFPRLLLYAPGNAKGMWSHDAVPPGPNLTSFLLNIQVLETKAGGLRTPQGHPRPGPGASCRGAVGPRGTPNTRTPPWKKCSIFVI